MGILKLTENMSSLITVGIMLKVGKYGEIEANDVHTAPASPINNSRFEIAVRGHAYQA